MLWESTKRWKYFWVQCIEVRLLVRFCHLNGLPDKSTWKEDLLSWGCLRVQTIKVEKACWTFSSHHGGSGSRKWVRKWPKMCLLRTYSQSDLHTSRPHCLKFLKHPQIVLLNWGSSIKIWTYGDILYSNLNIRDEDTKESHLCYILSWSCCFLTRFEIIKPLNILQWLPLSHW